MISEENYKKALIVIENYNRQLKKTYSKFPELSEFKIRRVSLNLSIKEVAEITGVGLSTIHRLEHNKEVIHSAVKSVNNFYVSLGG